MLLQILRFANAFFDIKVVATAAMILRCYATTMILLGIALHRLMLKMFIAMFIENVSENVSENQLKIFITAIVFRN